MMKIARGLIVLFFALSSALVFGQESKKYSGEYANFYRAEELFEKEQYGAAREVFTEFLSDFKERQDPQYIKALYYRGVSALELYNGDAIKLLMTFNNDYPENIYKNTIYYKIGDHFYQAKKYKDAKEWFEKTDHTDIDTAYIASYRFKLGYSNFQLGDFTLARNEFYDIKDGTTSYAAPAMYYYSYIAYKNKSYQEALEGFLTLKDHPSFSKEVPYYLTQIYYLLGDFQKVTEYAPDYIVSSKKAIHEHPAEMNLLIGDAYYKTEQYEEAIPYLEDYNKRKETTRDEDYALAYAYLKSGKYDNAIRLFDRVSREKDKLAQVAFYHIAECYAKKDELNYARTAFKSAADLPHNVKIQEDALYNYAVLSYQLDYNPYNEAIIAFELFLTEFPQSERTEDVYGYMANVYSSTKNYKEAIKSLERIPSLNVKLKAAYQVVSYNLGVEEFERGNYRAAIDAMKKVYKYDMSSKITGQAKFWEADAHYMLQEWNLAIGNYRAFLTIPGVNNPELTETAYYNIAYAYYSQEDWVQAIQAFRTFTQLSNIIDKAKLADAYARTGDCYYTKTDADLPKAALNYEQAYTYPEGKTDQNLFALARVYKLTSGKRDLQISTLKKLLNDFPRSNYVVPALLDIAKAYKNMTNFTEAMTNFNKIVNNYPNNILVKDALIEIADLKFKQQNYQESESYFKRVLNEYSLDDETCKRVTKGLIDVYRAQRRQEEIVSLSKKYPCAEISSNDEEVFYYETAAELYLSKKYTEAIPEINKYLTRYPNGRFSVQLLSYLANIYYMEEEETRALTYYEQIIARPNSAYIEEALIRAAKILYNSGEYSRALPHYEKLEGLASKPEVIFNTRIGVMRTNYIVGNYDKAGVAADKVLGDALLKDKEIKAEGNFIAGMSYFKVGKYDKSKSYLRWTADNTGAERGTEALFTLAEANFHLKDYTQAEKLHKELLKRTPSYQYWIGKSLILQAKVFMMKDDLFQAEQTIDLVLNNYPNKNDKSDPIMIEAEMTKAEIMQLKNEPKDLQNDINRLIDINDGENENDE